MTTIDQFSLTTVPLQVFFKNRKTAAETQLSIATSFVWQHHDNRHFLITNWHVATGRDALTRRYLKSHGGRPNMLRGFFNFPGQQFGKIQTDIYIRDSDDRPMWLIHPIEGAYVDVVAIRCRPSKEPDHQALPNQYAFRPRPAHPYQHWKCSSLAIPSGRNRPASPFGNAETSHPSQILVQLGPKHLLVGHRFFARHVWLACYPAQLEQSSRRCQLHVR